MGVALVGQSAPTFFLGILFILTLSLKAGLLPTSGRGATGRTSSCPRSRWAPSPWPPSRGSRARRCWTCSARITCARRAPRACASGAWCQARLPQRPPIPCSRIPGCSSHPARRAVVTETVFRVAGHRPARHHSIYNRDYPVVQCVVFLSAVLFRRPQLRHRARVWRPRSRIVPADTAPSRPRAAGAWRGAPRRLVAAGRGVRLLLLVARRRRGSRPTIRSASRCARGWPPHPSRAPMDARTSRTEPPRPRRAVAHALRRPRVGCWSGFAAVVVEGHASGSWPSTPRMADGERTKGEAELRVGHASPLVSVQPPRTSARIPRPAPTRLRRPPRRSRPAATRGRRRACATARRGRGGRCREVARVHRRPRGWGGQPRAQATGGPDRGREPRRRRRHQGQQEDEPRPAATRRRCAPRHAPPRRGLDGRRVSGGRIRRIEDAIHELDDEVEGDEETADRRHALHDRISRGCRSSGMASRPDARPREHRLRHHRAAEQGAELQPGDVSTGNGGVAEGVLGHHRPLRRPLARAVRT